MLKAGAGTGSAMRERLDWLKRLIGTGISFFVFGLAGLILGAIVFPLIRLVVRDIGVRTRIARQTISWTFRRFIGLMHGLGLLTYELRDFHRFSRRGLLVLANHPSLIDTVFLLGFVPDSTAIVGESLFRNSFTGAPLRAAGYIRNDGGPDALTQCVRALDSGLNVLIFPEGTRTPPDGAIRLRRGATNIAIRAERDITPVSIRCEPRTLRKGEPWWKIPDRPPRFTLAVGEDIISQSFRRPDEASAIAVRRLTAFLEHYFSTNSAAYDVN
jgi:1-acyl-sn-glycerol-3-phosphate acyltransferase